jgi:hypothetical protein
MLEINALPGRHLRQLVELIGERAVARELNIHPKTLYRWLTGRTPIPGRQHLAIRMLLGDLPGTDGQWHGWRFVRGELVSPAGEAFRAGDILSLILLRQQLTAQRQELEALRVRLAVAQQAVETLAPSANDARRWG